MNHRRIMALLVSLIMLFSLSGCQVVDNAVKSINDDPKNGEKEYAEQVFEYLKNEDIGSLCELFAPDVRAEHDLESEWKSFSIKWTERLSLTTVLNILAKDLEKIRTAKSMTRIYRSIMPEPKQITGLYMRSSGTIT